MVRFSLPPKADGYGRSYQKEQLVVKKLQGATGGEKAARTMWTPEESYLL
ncbi:hypothetical protein ccbrp13_69910 [Ktedonobacteria bacterium brp13]|nr:hypothetical protein ccbrp13_69910 [Ktedonobacteria bacterium brp13]